MPVDHEPTLPPTCARLPAEWEPQQALQLTWPRRDGAWGARFAEIEREFDALADAVAEWQPLLIACADADSAHRLRRRLGSAASVHVLPSNDVWVRDHGPIGVHAAGADAVLLDFRFDGWGGKYPADDDDRLCARLHAAGAYGARALHRLDWVLEGGSIDTDGAGTLLTTRECLLTRSRNPGRDQVWFEARFAELFGTRQVYWLDHGWLAGDDTDAHVDMLARFVAPGTLVHTACDDPADPHYPALRAMGEELAALRDASGRGVTCVPLPWPAACCDAAGERLPLSYANISFINGALLVPVYGVGADAAALSVYRDLLPDRQIIPVPARALIEQRGSIHCATQHLPAPTPQATDAIDCHPTVSPSGQDA
jgi:agmatine deiminase